MSSPQAPEPPRRRTAISLAGRIALTGTISSVLGFLVAGLILVHLFRQHIERRFDDAMEDDVIHIASSLARHSDGQLRLVTPLETPLYDQPGSGWVWQVRRGEQVLAQSASAPAGVVLTAPLNSSGDFRIANAPPVRGMARKIALADAGTMTLHVAGSRERVDADVAAFRRIAIIALGVLGLGLVMIVLVQVGYGLRPLRRLANDLRAMRRGEGRPAADGWPAEVAPLAAELNALQDHNDALVERGRRQAADLAHSLKTPLAILQNVAEEVDAPLQHELFAQTRRMHIAIQRNLTRTRTAGGAGRRTEVAKTVDELQLALDRLLSERGLVAKNQVAPEIQFFGAQEDLEEMLGNLLENAAKWAGSQVLATARASSKGIVIEVRDDGPGVPEAERRNVLGRGRRLDEAGPGQGIGLAMVLDIANFYGGDLHLEEAPEGGVAAILHLPGDSVPSASSVL